MIRRPTIALFLLLLAQNAFASEASAPISLSDPDGQELLLEQLDVRTAVHGMLALTELEMRFRNPRAEVAEGRFSCVLPAEATISRFAKEVNGVLMEGEVVERMRANRIYDEILHQMRDPALLEQDLGNRFSARVFPIEPRGLVRLVLSHSERVPAIDGIRAHGIPLRGLPRVARFSFHAILVPLPGEGDAEVSGLAGGRSMMASRVVSFTERGWVPEDIEIDRLAATPGLRLLRAGDYYLASYIPPPAPATRSIARASWLVYLDTSASSASGAAHRVAALEELLGSLPPGDPVEIVAFDQTLAPLFEGSAGESARRIAALLRERKSLGGTDVEAAVLDLARRAGDRRVLFVSDGVATQGKTGLHDLRAVFAKIPAGLTLHAVVLGSAQSAETLRALTKGRGRIVTVPFTESMKDRAREAASLLQLPFGETVQVRDAAAEWIYPAALEDVRGGREVFAVGKLKPGSAPEILLSGSAPHGFQVQLPAEGFETLLEREAYRGYLDDLREREAAEENEGVREALAQEQVRISVERRIMIPRTTLLVLESESEYQRFGLDRRALASILTIGLAGIEEVNRASLPQWRAPVPSKSIAEAITVTDPQDFAEIAAGEAPPAEAEEDLAGEESVEGGVEGGVLGGVVGGVAGGVVPGAPASQPITVAAEAPAAPSVAQSITIVRGDPPSRPRARPEKRDTWASMAVPSDSEVEGLFANLESSPPDRVLYSRLSEALLARREWRRLADLAMRWQPYDPENPQVYEVLSEAALWMGRREEAVRAAGSLVEIAVAKTELLQRAGLLLVRIAETLPAGDEERARLMDLAEAPLRRAVELRPDRLNAHRHLALALWRAGKIDEAARVLEEASRREFPDWYGDAKRVVSEELGWIYRARLAADPAAAGEIEDRAARFGVDLARRDELRITLAWETDANDVDLHVVEPSGAECWFSNQKTSTLELYEDNTQGLGPEVIRSGRRARGAYRIGVNYFAAGPMAVSRGIVVVLQARGARAPEVQIIPFRLVDDGREADVVEIARIP